MIEVRDLTVIYDGQVAALQNVDLEVHRGEFLTLVGPSGAGKSTLIRSILGLIRPTRGKVFFEGTDMAASDGVPGQELRRKIGPIFQQLNLVRRASVLTNVMCGRLGCYPWWRTVVGFSRTSRSLALRTLRRVGLEDKATRRVDTLSGGEQQRVAIARALVQSPDVILADEPVASLDPGSAEQVMQILKKINEEEALTVVTVLHDLRLVQSYGTRTVLMRHGKVAYDGPPADLDLLSLS